MKYDQFSAPMIESSNPSDTESTTDITEPGSVISRVSSSFKFVGNFADPAEILRRAPDFDSVILLLQEEIENIHQVSSSEDIERMIERAKDEKRHQRKVLETCDKNAEAQKQERLNVLKKRLGPPWAWLHKFTDYNCPKQSFNFIDITSSPVGSEDEEIDIKKERCTSAESSQTIIHFTSDDSRSKTFICDNESTSSSRVNSATVIGEILSDVMCKLNEAQSNGKCSVRDVKSLTRIIDTEFPHNENAKRLRGYLDKASSTGKDFNDLNELNSYFMGEIVKARRSDNGEDEDDEDPNETLKECDDPDKIVEIFEESGIDVDNKLLEKKVSETMILGLVKKPEETLAPPTSSDIDSESVKSIQSDDTTTASVVSSANKNKTGGTKDENVQTTPYLEQRQRQKMAEEAQRERSKEEPKSCEELAEEELHKSIIPPLPGIGPSVSNETTERFLLYLMRRARQQGGLVYPRNWQENECPPMVD